MALLSNPHISGLVFSTESFETLLLPNCLLGLASPLLSLLFLAGAVFNEATNFLFAGEESGTIFLFCGATTVQVYGISFLLVLVTGEMIAIRANADSNVFDWKSMEPVGLL